MYILTDPISADEWHLIAEQRLSQATLLSGNGDNTTALYLACHGLESAIKGYLAFENIVPSKTHDIEDLRKLASKNIPRKVFGSEAAKVFSIMDSNSRSNYTLLRYQSNRNCIPDIDTAKFISEISNICKIAKSKSRAAAKRRSRR